MPDYGTKLTGFSFANFTGQNLSDYTWDTIVGANSDVAQWIVPDRSRVTLNGATISVVTDRSTKGQNLLQATASLQPIWADNDTATRPVMSFDSGDYFVSGISMPTSGDFTVIAVMKTASFSGNSRYLFSGGDAGNAGFYVRITADGRFSYWVKGAGGNTGTGLANDNTPKLVMLAWDEANKKATLRYNGTEVSMTTGSISALSNATFWVATDPTLAFKFQAKVAEVLVIKANLKDAAKDALFTSAASYYLNRYGLTL